MSVWPDEPRPGTGLRGQDGELVVVRVSVEPRLLEQLLDSLAEVPFPINPEIHHHTSQPVAYPDGRREARPAVVVEFPAYSGSLEQVRRVLEQRGFDPRSVLVASMLAEIRPAGTLGESPPALL